MAIVRTQAIVTGAPTSGTSKATGNLTAVKVGNTLIAVATCYTSTAGAVTMTFSDTLGNAWTTDIKVQSALNAFNNSMVVAIGRAPITVGGTTAVTITESGAGTPDIAISAMEVSGLLQVIDASGSNSSGVSQTSLSLSSPLVVTNIPDLIVAGFGLDSNTTASGDASPISIGGGTAGVVTMQSVTTTTLGACEHAYLITSATGSYQVTETFSNVSTSSQAIAAVAYKGKIDGGSQVVINSGPGASPGYQSSRFDRLILDTNYVAAGGGVTQTLAGQSITSTLGTITPTVSYAVTGQTLTSTEGAPTVGVSYAVAGQSIASTEGAITSAIAYGLTGQGITSTEGTPTYTVSYGITGQLATFTEGTITAVWGGSATLGGQAIASALGAIAPTVSYAVNGQALTSTEGVIGPELDYAVAGQAITSTEGTITKQGDVTIQLAGQSLSLQIGVITATGGDVSTTTPAGRHTKRYGVRDGDRLLVFQNKADADAARRAIEARSSAMPAKALRKIKTRATLPEPVDVIPLASIKTVAASQNASRSYADLARNNAYTPLVNLYYELKRREKARMDAEEEEIAVILLHL